MSDDSKMNLPPVVVVHHHDAKLFAAAVEEKSLQGYAPKGRVTHPEGKRFCLVMVMDARAVNAAHARKYRRALIDLAENLHTFAAKPCPTCISVGVALGQPFGCEKLRKARPDAREAPE